MTKSQKIRVLLAEGVSVAEITKRVKCSNQLVYNVKSDWRNVQSAGRLVELHPIPDVVNHPKHYTVGGIETIDFIEAKKLGYNLGNVVKYVSRVDQKDDPIENLKKARWYLDREIAKRQELAS